MLFSTFRFLCRLVWLTTLIASLVMANSVTQKVRGQDVGDGYSQSTTTNDYVILIDTSTSMGQPSADGKLAGGLPSTKMSDVIQQVVYLKDNLPADTVLHCYSFNEELHRGPSIHIGAIEAKANMKTYLDTIQPTGRKTHLWHSLSKVLNDCQSMAEAHARSTVRLLIFTDGEDNDERRLDPETVLAEHAELLKSRVRLNYVTLGFEMKAELKRRLEARFVNVSAAMTADEIIPLDAAFRLLPAEPLPREDVTLVDESIGGLIRQRIIDWGDNTPKTGSRSPSHAYVSPGEYKVLLGIESSSGKRSVFSRTIVVRQPEPPKSSFVLASAVNEIKEPIDGIEVASKPLLANAATQVEESPTLRVPTWLLSAVTLGLVSVAASVAGVVLWKQSARSRELTEQLLLVGRFSARLGSGTRRQVIHEALGGSKVEEVFKLDPETRLILRSRLDELTEAVEYEVEMLRNEETVKIVSMAPNEEQQLGDWVVEFQTT